MKVRFNQESVINGFQNAISIISAKAGAAFLRSIWISAEDDLIKIQSTDGSIEYQGAFPAQVIEQGRVGIHGQTFYQLINNCIGEVELATDENGNLSLNHKLGTCKIPILPENWFQESYIFPDRYVSWLGEILQEALSRVTFCISDDQTMGAINFLYIKPMEEGRIDICGLNGHEFAMYSVINEDVNNFLPQEGVLIKKQYLSYLTKWLEKGKIDLAFNENRFFLRNNNETIMIPRGDMDYPTYTVFLDKLSVEDVSRLTIEKKDIIGTLNRVLTVNTKDKFTVDLLISTENQQLLCFAKGEGSGEISEQLPIEYNGNVKQIIFRTKNLLNIFDHFNSKKITLTLTSEEGVCSITGKEDPFFLVVAMPMKRVNSSIDVEENE